MTTHPLVYALSFLFIGMLAGIIFCSHVMIPMFEKRTKKKLEFNKKADAYAKAHSMNTSAELDALANGSVLSK